MYTGSRRTDCQTTKGNFVVMTNDSIVLAVNSEGLHQAIPRDLMTRFDVYAGRKSHLWVGAGIGLLGGAVAGAVTWTSIGGCKLVDDSECRMYGALLIGGIGAVVGGVVGAFIWKTDRWEEVPLDRLRVSLVPKRDGFALGLSVSF